VPVQVVAETFHEFAVRVLKSVGVDIDFASPNIFVEIEANCIANLENRNPDLDLLVIDEVQDFKPEWVNALLTRLKPNGTVFLLEDSDQQLYPDREEFELPDAITITSHENYRSPRSLVKLINGLRLADSEIESKSFFDGEMPNPLVYESSDQLIACTSSAVTRCLEKGFSIDDIVVISMRGRERSVIQKLDQLGDFKVKRFTGDFDESGNPIWTKEGILVDSVRRFKGQAAPAVIFTECDFESFTDINRKLLFVGITRARIHLEWVISSNLEKLIEQRLM
jgi:superfamily I DNA and RNA helicase